MAAFLEQNSVTIESEEYVGLTENLEWGGSQEENQGQIETIESVTVEGVTYTESNNNLDDGGNIKAKPDTVALMEIDKIDVKLPVAEGTELDILKFALGHMTETAPPLGAIGNSVVAGHRSHSFGTFFNRLDEVEIGDEIKVSVGGKTYIYEVYETLIVEPDDLSVLRGSSNHRVLTLITCHPMYTSTHRLIVHAVVRED